MSIPDYQSFMLPVLQALANGDEAPSSEIRERVANAENLTTEDRQQMLPSSRQAVYANRVGWAITYMKNSGLLERVRRGVYRLTDEGQTLLSLSPVRVDKKLLEEYPAFVEWRMGASHPSPEAEKTEIATTQTDESTDTPDEVLRQAVDQLHKALEADVLDRVRKAQPSFLEQVVVDLLIAMGYGGGDPMRGHVTGRSGD